MAIRINQDHAQRMVNQLSAFLEDGQLIKRHRMNCVKILKHLKTGNYRSAPKRIRWRKNRVGLSESKTGLDTGQQMEVVLECAEDRMQNVIDRFGNETVVYPGEGKNTYVRVKTVDSPAFYSWVCGFDGDIWIVEPRMAVIKYRKMLKTGFR